MKSLLALMLLSGMILCSSAEAKKVPPPAPNLAASFNFKTTIEGTGDVMADVNSSLAMSHSFSITPEQEAALQPNTVISIMYQDFELGSDPNFQNGDKSATFERNFALIGPEMPCTVSIKWNKGKLTISVKGKLKEKNYPMETAEAKINTLQSRSPYTFNLESSITHPSISPLTVQAVLASDAVISTKEGVTAEGTEYMGLGFSIQSKSFIYQN